jgi:hypothetical protein
MSDDVRRAAPRPGPHGPAAQNGAMDPNGATPGAAERLAELPPELRAAVALLREAPPAAPDAAARAVAAALAARRAAGRPGRRGSSCAPPGWRGRRGWSRPWDSRPAVWRARAVGPDGAAWGRRPPRPR